jgi:hypothetical protein
MGPPGLPLKVGYNVFPETGVEYWLVVPPDDCAVTLTRLN